MNSFNVSEIYFIQTYDMSWRGNMYEKPSALLSQVNESSGCTLSFLIV